jgi:hypothetical protein
MPSSLSSIAALAALLSAAVMASCAALMPGSMKGLAGMLASGEP